MSEPLLVAGHVVAVLPHPTAARLFIGLVDGTLVAEGDDEVALLFLATRYAVRCYLGHPEPEDERQGRLL